jgi:serine/threonine-protein kinase
MLAFACPNCRTRLQTAEDQAGKQITCPACARSMFVPSPDALETVPPCPVPEGATLPPASSAATDSAQKGSVPGYEIISELGRGGMGVVYKARQVGLDRVVALKMILHGVHAGADDLLRFRTEAEAIARLQHPNIVAVYEIGQHEGKPFFSLEFCSGGSLDRKLAGTPVEPRVAAKLLGQLARAMQAAHEQHIIHRDLKPANVLLTAMSASDAASAKPQATGPPAAGQQAAAQALQGVVPKITDFGLARKLDQAGQTQSGVVMGTPSYMAPEQAEGKKTVGPPADVYALGAILYECLTGRPPFKAATSLDTILQVVSDEPVPPRQLNARVPADLQTIALKCLSKEAGKRYSSAAELADDLERFLAGEPIKARPVGRLERAAKWLRRNPALAGVVAAAALVVVLGTAGAVYAQQQRLLGRERAASGRAQAEAGLAQAVELRRGYRFADAQAMLKQVHGWANQAEDSQLEQRLAQAEIDLALARELDGVRQQAATQVEGKWDPDGRMREKYPQVLSRHGLDVLEGDLDELAQTIKASAVRDDLVAALDDWARAETDPQKKQRLLGLANRADESDPWRQAVRLAVARRDGKRLRQLVRATGEGRPVPGVVLLLADIVEQESEEPTALLRRMQLERPRDFWVSFDLGNRLQEHKKYQDAAECFLVAVALRPDSAPAHGNLGLALQDMGKADEAIACFKRAVALNPRDANAHGALGHTLMQHGQFSAAQEALGRCLGLLPPNHPLRGRTAQLFQKCRQLLDADTKLKMFLAGKEVPANAATQTLMAEVAQRPFKRLYLTSVRLYRDAFASQPRLAETFRCKAACAAALAGTGQGNDVARLDAMDRAELRYSALCWLQEHLGAGVLLLAQQPGAVGAVRQNLLHWQKDPNLAGVRDSDSLAKLPEAEQVAWLNFWAEVDTQLRQTRAGK